MTIGRIRSSILKGSPMSATTAARDVRAAARPAAGFDRWVIAILMPIGPLAIAVLRGLLPYFTTDSNTTAAAKIADHQGVEMITIWLTFIALFTLIPGVIALGLFARRQSRKLGSIGLVIAFAAFMCLFWSTVSSSDDVALGAARLGMSPATAGALNDSIGKILPIAIGENIFVLGHILGLLLLAVALWRGRAVATWIAVMLGGSQLMHFVFAVIVPNHALDAVAWGLTAAAFGLVAAAMLREPRPAPELT